VASSRAPSSRAAPPRNVYQPEDAIRVSEAFMKELGLASDDLDGLRAAPLEAVLAAQERARLPAAGVIPQLPFQPVVDGECCRARAGRDRGRSSRATSRS